MRKGAPQPIGDVVKEVVEKLSQTKKKDAARISSAWEACAGKELSRHTRPASLRSGTLRVFVDNSAWFYQASLQKEKLLAKLQRKIGEDKIRQIQLRIGQIKS